jgi:hypothetical protein
MPRYIDADALIQKRAHAKDYGPDMYVIGQGYVMDAPTVDAVPVVRCKDCKHYQTDVLFNSNYCCGRRRKPDDYCSYGERKESEGGT